MNVVLCKILLEKMVKTIYGEKVKTTFLPYVEAGSAMTTNGKLVAIKIGSEAFKDGVKDVDYAIIVNKFPHVLSYNPLLFVVLHEIGHAHFKGVSNMAFRFIPMTSQEYRDLPQEKFADKWAADYMKRNPALCKLWSQAFDKVAN